MHNGNGNVRSDLQQRHSASALRRGATGIHPGGTAIPGCTGPARHAVSGASRNLPRRRDPIESAAERPRAVGHAERTIWHAKRAVAVKSIGVLATKPAESVEQSLERPLSAASAAGDLKR